MSAELSDKPMVLEVFVDLSSEIDGDGILKYKATGIKGKIQEILGEDNYDKLKAMIKPKNEIGVIKADMSK